MLDVAIIGGGLCGLALARKLRQRGRDVSLSANALLLAKRRGPLRQEKIG